MDTVVLIEDEKCSHIWVVVFTGIRFHSIAGVRYGNDKKTTEY